jgi:AAR2 protein
MDDGSNDVRWLASLSRFQLTSRVRAGGDLFLVGFPAGTAVALDLRVYDTGLIRVRAVPPGIVHVIALLSEGVEGDGPPGASCVATFFKPSVGFVTVIEYVDNGATLRAVEVENQATYGQSDDEGELNDDDTGVGDRGVAIYSVPHERRWRAVAGSIDSDVLRRAGGARLLQAVIFCELDEGESCKEEASAGDADVPYKMGFVRLPDLRRAGNMSAEEVTEFNLDRSAYVRMLVATRFEGRPAALLGELQLAFVSFLVQRNIGGLVHWAALVREMAQCDDLASEAPELIAGFACCLTAHLNLIERDVLDHLGDRRLEDAVLLFTSGTCSSLHDVQKLAISVSNRFGWIPGPNHH